MKKIIVYIDGGSRGNPGPAALGCVIAAENGQIKEYSEFLGKKTNNEAEYRALIFALKKTRALFGRQNIKTRLLEVNSDSELLVKQMKGEYKVKGPEIQKLFLQAWNLKIGFGQVDFILIPREQNKRADSLVNNALDSQAKTQKLL